MHRLLCIHKRWMLKTCNNVTNETCNNVISETHAYTSACYSVNPCIYMHCM